MATYARIVDTIPVDDTEVQVVTTISLGVGHQTHVLPVALGPSDAAFNNNLKTAIRDALGLPPGERIIVLGGAT